MNKIINILKEQKSIPLDKFIKIALYDKRLGYYMKNSPLGKNGDFITSPLISRLFGEMIAIWCVSFWKSLNKPQKVVLVELGPGNGILCDDLLRSFKHFKHFYNSLEINLLEKSYNLKKIQKEKIRNNKVKWIKNIKNIKKGPIIFISNEFFDALPIKQFCQKNGLIYERHVTLSKKDKKIKFIIKKANKNLVRNIKKLDLISNGTIIEYPKETIEYLEIISKKINELGGGFLTFDYGDRNNNTLQSIKNHKHVNILSHAGSADISSHVNFRIFSKIFSKNKLNVEKLTTQSKFLQKLGVLERANIMSKKVSFKTKADMFYRLKRLIDPNEMGGHFKVFFAKKKGKKFNLGF
jgi:cyclopropane-fatty-acyl-phospholipid synthase